VVEDNAAAVACGEIVYHGRDDARVGWRPEEFTAFIPRSTVDQIGVAQAIRRIPDGQIDDVQGLRETAGVGIGTDSVGRVSTAVGERLKHGRRGIIAADTGEPAALLPPRDDGSASGDHIRCAAGRPS